MNLIGLQENFLVLWNELILVICPFCTTRFNELIISALVYWFCIKFFSLYFRLSFFRKLPSKSNIRKPFKFHQSTYKKMPISFMNRFFKNPNFAEEITFFPFIILINLCDETCFCVNNTHSEKPQKNSKNFWNF